MRTLLHADPARYPRLRQTASYLAATETHTFASSVAAHALLSFFPFIVLLLSLTRNFLHSERLYHSLLQLLRAYLPVSDLGPERTQTFIISNLQLIVEHQRAVQVASLVILLATCTGIFLPLEVALNHIWHAAENRSYLRNWVSAIGLAFSCGVLGMLSASFTSLTETYSLRLSHFLIHVGERQAAITAGLLWEVSKYVYIFLLPWLAFRDIYGPFAISVSLLLWAYVSALILLTCAETVAPISAPEGQRQLDFTVQVPMAATPQAGVGAGVGTGVESELAEAAKPRA